MYQCHAITQCCALYIYIIYTHYINCNFTWYICCYKWNQLVTDFFPSSLNSERIQKVKLKHTIAVLWTKPQFIRSLLWCSLIIVCIILSIEGQLICQIADWGPRSTIWHINRPSMLYIICQVVAMLRLTIMERNPLVSATVGQRPFCRLICHISNLPTIHKLLWWCHNHVMYTPHICHIATI